MLRRLFFGFLWALFFLLAGLLVTNLFVTRTNLPDGTVLLHWNRSVSYIPVASVAAGLLLSLIGWLPGTRPHRARMS